MTKEFNLIERDDYKKLVPRPSDEDYKALHKSIMIHRKALEPIKVNMRGEILDGFTRYEICKKLNLDFEIEVIDLPSTEAEMEYIIDVNKNRRHLQRNDLEVLRKAQEDLQDLIKQAEKNKLAGIPVDQVDQKVNVRKEISKKTGYSEGKITKLAYLKDHATEETKKALTEKEISLNKAYEKTKSEVELKLEPKLKPEPKKENNHFAKISNDLLCCKNAVYMYKKYKYMDIDNSEKKTLIAQIKEINEILEAIRTQILKPTQTVEPESTKEQLEKIMSDKFNKMMNP